MFCYMTIAAVITGCANTNNDAVSSPAETRNVLVSFTVDTNTLPMEAASASKLSLKTGGYRVFVNDEERWSNVSLYDQLSMVVPADAIIHVIHKDSVKDLNADVVDAFSLTGNLRMKARLKEVVIPMENHDFGLITVDHSEYLFSSTLNNTNLFSHEDGYSYAYTARHEGLVIVDTVHNHSYHHIDVTPGTHYEFTTLPEESELSGKIIFKEKDMHQSDRLISGINF